MPLSQNTSAQPEKSCSSTLWPILEPAFIVDAAVLYVLGPDEAIDGALLYYPTLKFVTAILKEM